MVAAPDAEWQMMTERKPKKPPRPATPEVLAEAALRYLQRFAATSADLRRVLLQRVRRSARDHGTDAADGARHVEALVTRYEAAGLLNDAAFAEARAQSLHRRGTSARGIRHKLRQKGVASAEIDSALEQLVEVSGAEDARAVEIEAAGALARRRRLGPWRRTDRAANRERDLAALARAGFRYDVAKAVIDGDG